RGAAPRLADADGRVGRLETTLEADPLTFDARRLELFRRLGVTRLSIGLQSSQDAVLAYLGRAHDAEAGLEAVRLALASGMRVNVDVIMAVPGQRLADDLRTVLDLGVNHLSVYSLTIEPDTPFGRRGIVIDPDVDADAFELAGDVVAEYGLERYEVSNFARPGEESLHNLAYWRGDRYLALGPGASAYLPEGAFGTRTKNPPIKTWLLGAPPERDVLDADDVVLERLMTGLRTREGVDLARRPRAPRRPGRGARAPRARGPPPPGPGGGARRRGGPGPPRPGGGAAPSGPAGPPAGASPGRAGGRARGARGPGGRPPGGAP